MNLVTSAQTPGRSYTLTVSGVKDQSAPANTVAAGSTVPFASWTLAQGYLAFEHYDAISGAADADIDKALADARVIATNPTTSGFISGRFDTRTVFPDDSHENDFARMTGWSLNSPAYIVPMAEEVTLTFAHRYSFEGDYWDGGQVRISVNGGDFTPVNPDNFTVNGYAPGKIQGSGVINGQRAFNGDSAGYAAGTFITSSAFLGSFNANDRIVVQFLGNWDDCTTASTPGWVIQSVQLAYGTAPRASTFEAEATASRQGKTTPFAYQWQRDDGAGFVDIAAANTASYRIFPVAADLNARFRVVASVPGRSLPGNSVKLFTGSAAPTLAIARTPTGATVTYTGTLQSATAVSGPYSAVNGATSPYPVPASSGTVFFRSTR